MATWFAGCMNYNALSSRYTYSCLITNDVPILVEYWDKSSGFESFDTQLHFLKLTSHFQHHYS